MSTQGRARPLGAPHVASPARPAVAPYLLLVLLLAWLPCGVFAQQAQPAANEPPTVTFEEPTAGQRAAADAPDAAASGGNQGMSLNIGLEGEGGAGNVSVTVQLVLLMTVLTLAPSLIMLMTSFTRMVIVLGFVRTAIGVPSAPSNQIVIGLALFLTFFIMGPVLERTYDTALEPYLNREISSSEAIERASIPMREFMLKQTRTRDLEFFLQLGRFPPTRVDELPMRVVIPAFIVSELQTAFQMGFLVFLPFLIIDVLVSSVLMSLGMMMMPPAIVSLPFKLLLFVLVDGWHLVVQSLVQSFAT